MQIGALVDAKDGEINVLSRQLQQQTTVKYEEKKKVAELEVYIKLQEEHYSNHSAQLELEKSKMTTKYEQLVTKYEQKRPALMAA